MLLSYNEIIRKDLLTHSKSRKIENLLEKIKECVKTGRYRDTMHAAQRKKERKIILPEIIHVLTTGRHEKSKDRFDDAFNSWNYAIRGGTLDEMDLRVIISFEQERDLLIITAFYIEEEK